MIFVGSYRKLSICIFFILCIIHARAQQTGESIYVAGIIKGKVIDKIDSTALPFVSVGLYRRNDSLLISSTVSDEKGSFRFEKIAFEKYYIRLHSMGYDETKTKNFNLSEKKPLIKLGKIGMSKGAYKLSTVTITEERPMIEYVLGKEIINVEKNISNSGGTAIDILRNVPSVTVDVNDKVQLRGQSNIDFLIDGRPAKLSASSIDQIPASSIENIEIITNPSAKYNPEGSSGIINIVLKKNREKGFNCIFIGGAGTHDRYNTSLNLNYNFSRFNIFASYNYHIDNKDGSAKQYRTAYSNDSVSYLDQTSISTKKKTTNHLRLGTDISLNKNNMISLSVLMNITDKFNPENMFVKKFNMEHVLYKNYTTNNNAIENSNDFNYSLNYKKNFSKKGRELTADLIYSTNKGEKGSAFSQQYFLSNQIFSGDPILNNLLTNDDENSTVIQINYTHPINKDNSFETGYQSIIKTSGSNFDVENYEYNSAKWVHDLLRSNDFIYSIQTHALYGLYTRQINKYTAQAGLRMEKTYVKSDQKTTSIIYNSEYFNFYPSVLVSRKFDDSKEMQFSYSRKINRPGQSTLNPFIDYSKKEVLKYGNPKLTPEYSNSFELEYIKRYKKSSIITTLFYHRINDIIKRITSIDTNRIAYKTYSNLSTGISEGAEFVFSHQVSKYIKINASYSYFKTLINGFNLGTELSNANYSWTAKFAASIKLPWDLNFQLNGNYDGPDITPQGIVKEVYSLDAGLKREFLKNKAGISLRVSDIFNSLRYNSNTNGEGFLEQQTKKKETRFFFIRFTYKINVNAKHKKENQDDDDEKPNYEEELGE